MFTWLAFSHVHPLLILAIGLATIVGMLLVLRANPFVTLVTAAMLVSLLVPGDPAKKIERVAVAFGTMAGKIGVIIALAAIIGKCLMESGAADRIVRSFLDLCGATRIPEALAAAAFSWPRWCSSGPLST
jgi:gluconate:H+ symporter, GntP family